MRGLKKTDNETNLIQKYLGTAYDKVVAVYERLADITSLADGLAVGVSATAASEAAAAASALSAANSEDAASQSEYNSAVSEGNAVTAADSAGLSATNAAASAAAAAASATAADGSATSAQNSADAAAASAASIDTSAFMQKVNNLSDLTNKPAALSTLGGQPASTKLTQITSLGTVEGRMLYTASAGVWGETTLTAFSRTLLDDADAATARATLGVAVGADVQAHSAALDQISGLGSNTGKYLYTTAANTWAEGTITSFMRGALNSADAAALITNASLGEACAYNVDTGADFTLNPSMLATRVAIKGFVDTTLAGYEAGDSLAGRWAGYTSANPAGFSGIDTLKVFSIKGVVDGIATNTNLQARFSTDGGTTWSGYVNISTRPSAYLADNAGFDFLLNLETGQFITQMDGVDDGSAMTGTLTIPAGANAIQLRMSSGSIYGAAMLIEERA